MVTLAVDGHDRPIDIRTPGGVRARPGERFGVRVSGEATLHKGSV
ncbi:hypothetical protein [Streptomyces sp. NBC_01353]|nr:hypothetical protein [Streptomyces sp. NBC_01353]